MLAHQKKHPCVVSNCNSKYSCSSFNSVTCQIYKITLTRAISSPIKSRKSFLIRDSYSHPCRQYYWVIVNRQHPCMPLLTLFLLLPCLHVKVTHFYKTIDQQMIPSQQPMLLEAALQFEHIIKHPKTDADGKVHSVSLWDTVCGTCASQAIMQLRVHKCYSRPLPLLL